ncbi:MAG: hypothetical protein ACFN9G_03765, partial [Cardiobacterium sp.]
AHPAGADSGNACGAGVRNTPKIQSCHFYPGVFMYCQVIPFSIFLNILAVALLAINEFMLLQKVTPDIKAKEEKVVRITSAVFFFLGIIALSCGTGLLIVAWQIGLPDVQLGISLLPITSLTFILLLVNNLILVRRLNQMTSGNTELSC